jgi:hypothetical protein
MAAHVGTATYTGNIYSISAALPAAYDATSYAVTSVVAFTVIGEVSDFPAYGAKASVGKFNPINGAIEKFKGVPDYGSGNLVFADVPGDAGQIIVKAAALSPNAHYSMKVTSPDGEIDFLDVIVGSYELAAQKENTPKTRTCAIEVCRAPVNVAA